MTNRFPVFAFVVLLVTMIMVRAADADTSQATSSPCYFSPKVLEEYSALLNAASELVLGDFSNDPKGTVAFVRIRITTSFREGQDSLITMVRNQRAWSAHLRRPSGRGIAHQVGTIAEEYAKGQHPGGEADDPECLLPPRDTVLARLEIEELTTDETRCPAMLERLEAIDSIPLLEGGIDMKTPEDAPIVYSEGAGYSLRLSSLDVDLQLHDSSASTAADRWVAATQVALGSCWRPAEPRAPARN
jgi:hypothetical protein